MRTHFLDESSVDDFLLKPILACSYAVMSNRENDGRGRQISMQFYIQAINATQAALQDPRKVTEDNTLISVYLLAIFEVSTIFLVVDNLR